MPFRPFYSLCRKRNVQLVREVSLQQAIEASAMAGLILSHLMNGVMDCIVAQFLRALCDLQLAFASARLSLCTHLDVLLGAVGNYFAEQLCELRSMLCLFECISLERFRNLRIAFPRSA